jgi:MoxR-like ATPase
VRVAASSGAEPPGSPRAPSKIAVVASPPSAHAGIRSGGAGPEAESLDIDQFRGAARAIEEQVGAVMVGQAEAVRGTLICLIGDGHALLEGVPGVGKTTLAKAFASALGLPHTRIQFTPDLMPADITGTTVLVEDESGRPQLDFRRGPVFASLVLADEINRASPRTQSALLEAMQEGTVTITGTTHRLPKPFCVLATQNPVELQGTYPLPEAQLDRFLLKLRFEYPAADELCRIIGEHPLTGAHQSVERVADASLLLRMNALARSVPAAAHVLGYVSRLLLAMQPASATATPLVRQYVRLGPSPRGGQSLVLAGRITALLDGRPNLAFEDVRAMAMPALRHRLVLSFDAERQAITPEDVISEALAGVPEQAS